MTEEMIMTAHKYAEDNRQKIADANPSIAFVVLRTLSNFKDGDYILLNDIDRAPRKAWNLRIVDEQVFWGQRGVGSSGHSWDEKDARIATKEDIERWIIKTAMRFGWRGGDSRVPHGSWSSHFGTIRMPQRDIPKYKYNEEIDTLYFNGISIYRNGEWALRG